MSCQNPSWPIDHACHSRFFNATTISVLFSLCQPHVTYGNWVEFFRKQRNGPMVLKSCRDFILSGGEGVDFFGRPWEKLESQFWCLAG
jgi:hypothetical protein